jgi:uncharacterized protein
MQIQLEAHETHTIQAYSDTEIKINQVMYHTNLILSRDTLITPWAIEEASTQLLDLNPEIIILGTHTPNQLRQLGHLKKLEQQLCEKQIGIECMTIDAACRTFNILLSEHRRVVAGFIFDI